MTGKQLVYKAIGLGRPSLIPRSTRRRDLDGSDTVMVGVAPAADFAPAAPGADEWGCVRRHNAGQGQAGYPVFNPLGNWEEYTHYQFPDAFAKGRFDHIDRRIADGDRQLDEKFVIASIGHGPIEKLSFLLGFENFLLTLAAHPERIEELVRVLGTPAGGFIGTINNMIDPCVPRSKIDTAWQAYREFRWEGGYG